MLNLLNPSLILENISASTFESSVFSLSQVMRSLRNSALSNDEAGNLTLRLLGPLDWMSRAAYREAAHSVSSLMVKHASIEGPVCPQTLEMALLTCDTITLKPGSELVPEKGHWTPETPTGEAIKSGKLKRRLGINELSELCALSDIFVYRGNKRSDLFERSKDIRISPEPTPYLNSGCWVA